MPAQQRRRRDEEGDPALPREGPTLRREEDAVEAPEPGRARRPAEHPELMTEDEDLEVPGDVISVTLAADDEETDEGADDKVDERPHQPIVPVVIRARIGVSDPHELARELLAAGIDLTDQSAVQRWIDERNEGLPIRRP